MKKYISIAILIVCAGVIFASRYAYICPRLGSFVNLAIPPEGLYDPIVELPLEKGKREYEFMVSHKYPGDYSVDISVPSLGGMTNLESDILIDVSVSKNGEDRYQVSDIRGCGYWGGNRQGLGYKVYHFPSDMDYRSDVNIKVTLSGDVDGFINHYGEAVIQFTKASDK